MILVSKDYMDEQYKWLEELIKRADMPDPTPKCDAGDQALDGAADKVRKYVLPHEFCFTIWKLTVYPEKSTRGVNTMILKQHSTTEPATVRVPQVCSISLSNGETLRETAILIASTFSRHLWMRKSVSRIRVCRSMGRSRRIAVLQVTSGTIIDALISPVRHSEMSVACL
jgi:hypothetical protein